MGGRKCCCGKWPWQREWTVRCEADREGDDTKRNEKRRGQEKRGMVAKWRESLSYLGTSAPTTIIIVNRVHTRHSTGINRRMRGRGTLRYRGQYNDSNIAEGNKEPMHNET